MAESSEVDQIMQLTGVPEAQARTILEAADGDMATAISLFFEESSGPPPAPAPAPAPAPPPAPPPLSLIHISEPTRPY